MVALKMAPAAALLLLGSATLLIDEAVLRGSGRLQAGIMTLLVVSGWSTLVLAAAAVRFPRWRFFGLALFLAGGAALPVAVLIGFHWSTGIPLDMHDGMFQTQVVAERLMTGHDPYGTDFTKTALVEWFHYTPDGSAIAHHYVYFPLVVLLAVPVVALEGLAGLGSDLRPLTLAISLAAAVVVFRAPFSWRVRYLLLALLFLDPYFGWMEGRNDILWLAPIVAATGLWMRDRRLAAATMIGVAAALKIFAWPFALFMALALLFRWRRREIAGREVVAVLAALCLPLTVTALPFLLWNPHAFIDDTAGWLMANPPGFPIYGFGLGEALYLTHLLPTTSSPFPFALVQAALGLPVLIAGVRALRRDVSIGNILGPATVMLAVIVVCGRFTNDNYLASLLFLFALTIAARRTVPSQAAARLAQAAAA
jgi:hypothetical protein